VPTSRGWACSIVRTEAGQLKPVERG
jgi:hypothetical protein